MSSAPILLFLVFGSNIGANVAETFTAQGCNLALVSSKIPEEEGTPTELKKERNIYLPLPHSLNWNPQPSLSPNPPPQSHLTPLATLACGHRRHKIQYYCADERKGDGMRWGACYAGKERRGQTRACEDGYLVIPPSISWAEETRPLESGAKVVGVGVRGISVPVVERLPGQSASTFVTRKK
jgi:hypothetical protein